MTAPETTNPLKALVRRKWDERDRSALLQWVHGPMSFDSHVVVRHHHARRVRHALFDALKAKGLDQRGKPLDDKGKAQKDAVSPINGSLDIRVRPGTATATNPELQRELHKAVDRILEHVQRSRAS